MPSFTCRRAAGALAPLLVCATIVVIVASAALRLTSARETCSTWWPACQRASERVPADAIASPADPALRAAHRAAAALVMPLAVGLLWRGLARAPRDRYAAGAGILVLGLAAFLAVLGALAGGTRALPVTLGNLLGGFGLLAGAHCLVLRSRPECATAEFARPARVALAAWLLQIGLGAGAEHAATAAVGWLHLLWAPVAAYATARLARRLRQTGRAALGAALLGLTVAQWISGGTAALFGLPAGWLVAHNLGAALVVALLAGLSWPPRVAS